MDYGYQLLRHVVQQVFGNLGAAARLTLLLFFIPFIALLVVTGGTGTAFAAGGDGGAGSLVFGVIIVGLLAVFCYCWGAVGWHRYVLLEELGSGFLPIWRPSEVVGYLGRAIIVVLVVIGAGLLMGIAVGLVTLASNSFAVSVFFGIGVVFGLSWIATRIGLVLPAAALGERMAIGESWRATAPVSAQILLPLIVIALVVGIIQQIIILIFGTTMTVEQFGTLQEVPILTLPGQILNAGVSWVQLLVNLALATTLYGNLIEGRQLN